MFAIIPRISKWLLKNSVFCLLILVLQLYCPFPGLCLVTPQQMGSFYLFYLKQTHFVYSNVLFCVRPFPMKLGTSGTPRPAKARTQCQKTWSDSAILLNCREVWSPCNVRFDSDSAIVYPFEPTSMIVEVEI